MKDIKGRDIRDGDIIVNLLYLGRVFPEYGVVMDGRVHKSSYGFSDRIDNYSKPLIVSRESDEFPGYDMVIDDSENVVSTFNGHRLFVPGTAIEFHPPIDREYRYTLFSVSGWSAANGMVEGRVIESNHPRSRDKASKPVAEAGDDYFALPSKLLSISGLRRPF